MEAPITYTPSHIANFILSRSWDEKIGVSQIALQKLTYISYGWALVILDHSLFDEKFYAWKHGPVCASLYHEFKHFGKYDITEPSYEFKLGEDAISTSNDASTPEVPESDVVTTSVLSKVWNVYKDFNPWELVRKTHETGSPWHQVYKEGERWKIIPDEIIKPHFEAKIREYLL